MDGQASALGSEGVRQHVSAVGLGLDLRMFFSAPAGLQA